MELTRDVQIEKYWPRVIGDMRDFGEIAKGEDPEFKFLWEAVRRFIDDCFVHSATEYAIARWEKIFDLETYPTDTLDQRRARILAAINRKIPYTMRSLRRMLEALVGEGNCRASVDPIQMQLTVLVNVRAEHMMDDVRALLAAIIPANLTYTVAHLYSQHEELKAYTHAQLAQYTHKYIQEQLTT